MPNQRPSDSDPGGGSAPVEEGSMGMGRGMGRGMGSAGQFEHAQERLFGTGPQIFWKDHLRREVAQAAHEFLHAVHLHVSAVRTGAVVRWSGDEFLFRAFAAQAVQHAAFRGNDELAGRMAAAEVDHFLRAADFIGEGADHGVSGWGGRTRDGVRRLLPGSCGGGQGKGGLCR